MTQGKQAKPTQADGGPTEALAAAIADGDSKVHLVLGWRRKSTYDLQRVDLAGGVSKTFLKYARATAEQLAVDRAETPYDPEWPLGDHQYFALSGDELPGSGLFGGLDDFLNLDRFKKASLRKPHLYVAAIQTGKGNAFFGRRMAYLKILNQKGGSFAAIWDGSTFNELVSSVATFATSFDWVLWDKTLYVLDTDAFHAQFRDNEQIKQAVADHVAQIQTKVTIDGADAFVTRCQSSVQMASKLKRVAEDGIWAEPVADLKVYAKERGLDIEWTDDDALRFDGSIETQWAILKLLDEDRTEGPVSGRTYDSAAKRRIEISGA